MSESLFEKIDAIAVKIICGVVMLVMGAGGAIALLATTYGAFVLNPIVGVIVGYLCFIIAAAGVATAWQFLKGRLH